MLWWKAMLHRAPRAAPTSGANGPHRGDQGARYVVPQVAPASSLARQPEVVAAPAGLGGEVAAVDRRQVHPGAARARSPGCRPPRAGRPCPGCWRAGRSRSTPQRQQHLRGDGVVALVLGEPERRGWPRRCRARRPAGRRRRACCRARCPGPPGAGRAGSRRRRRSAPPPPAAGGRSRSAALPKTSPVRHSLCSRTSGGPAAAADRPGPPGRRAPSATCSRPSHEPVEGEQPRRRRRAVGSRTGSRTSRRTVAAPARSAMHGSSLISGPSNRDDSA